MICSALLGIALAATAPQTTVVVPLKAVGVPANDVSIPTAELRTQIGRSERYRLVTPEEMSAVDEELTRQLSGGATRRAAWRSLGGARRYLDQRSGRQTREPVHAAAQADRHRDGGGEAHGVSPCRQDRVLLLKLPEVASDLLGEQPSKRQVVVNATAKVASKLLEKVAERQALSPLPPRNQLPPALASEEMGLVLRTSYRPLAMLLGGSATPWASIQRQRRRR